MVRRQIVPEVVCLNICRQASYGTLFGVAALSVQSIVKLCSIG